MNEQQRKFEVYLDEQIAARKQRSKLLTADDRVDETLKKSRQMSTRFLKRSFPLRKGSVEGMN